MAILILTVKTWIQVWPLRKTHISVICFKTVPDLKGMKSKIVLKVSQNYSDVKNPGEYSHALWWFSLPEFQSSQSTDHKSWSTPTSGVRNWKRTLRHPRINTVLIDRTLPHLPHSADQSFKFLHTLLFGGKGVRTYSSLLPLWKLCPAKRGRQKWGGSWGRVRVSHCSKFESTNKKQPASALESGRFDRYRSQGQRNCSPHTCYAKTEVKNLRNIILCPNLNQTEAGSLSFGIES